MKSKMKTARYAGELLVAAELARLGFVVSIHNTFGVNTPGFDLSAATEDGDRTVQIQVKALKGPNAFLINPEKIKKDAGYVFVVVGEAGTLPAFYVAMGHQVLAIEKVLFGKWGRNYPKAHGRGFRPNAAPAECRDGWGNLGLG